MDNKEAFDVYAIEVDSDIVDRDLDSIDLYGEIMEEDDDNYGDNIAFE